MSKNQLNSPITDQEIAFAHLLLSGTMTDRQAAKAVGFNPATAANTKAKPRVSTYMFEHRAGMHEQIAPQETEEQHRRNASRERVLACLWKVADLTPEMTRNSMCAQMKALSMIVAIEGLIPDRKTDRRAGAAQNKSNPAHPPMDTAWLREQEKTTGFQPSPDPLQGEDEPGVPDPAASQTVDAPDSDFGQSLSETASSATPAPVSAPTEKKRDTWRFRL